jgi:DedD protein
VGAFAESAPAEKLAERLRRKGLPVFVTPGAGQRDSRWRVRVGPLASRAEAERVAARLKSEDRLPTWVIEEGR